MDTPKAILIGFALVAAAVYFSRGAEPVQAALGGAKFQIFAHQGLRFLKLNVDTGKVAWCKVAVGSSNDKAIQISQANMVCSKFH